MGGTSTIADLQQQVTAQRPDVIIIPECKLKPAQRRSNYLQRAFGREYHLIHSLLPAARKVISKKERYKPGAAGVTICIKKQHTAHNSLAVVPIEDRSLEGYAVHIQIGRAHV